VRLPPSGVAERLGVDRPTLSGVLARLERDGWLLSEPNPDDGRSRLLLLTPRSESALPELRAASDRVSARALRGLGPEDVRRLAGMLDDIVRSLETGEETAGRP
jgi:MarR family transcriptional regulator for hemolysin